MDDVPKSEKDRRELEEHVMGKKRERLAESEAERRCKRLERKLWTIIDHWNDFGPEHGFEDLMRGIEKGMRRWERD